MAGGWLLSTNPVALARSGIIDLRPDLWNGYWDLASYYQRRARYDEAANQFLEVIRLVPDHDRAYNSLGGIYYYQKKFDQAEAMFKKSLAIRPTPQAYSNFGALYLLQRRYAEAVPMLKNAIQTGAANRESWGNLAEAYTMIPSLAAEAPAAYRRAAELAEKQLAVNPSNASVRAGLTSRGHRVIDNPGGFGGYQAILIDPRSGLMLGGSDPRKDGMAAGY